MKKRIFRSLCFTAFGVFAACAALFFFVLYDYFGEVQQNRLQMQTELAAHALTREGKNYFEGLPRTAYRMTWIAPDGKVLFDDRFAAEKMDDHGDREEIKTALAVGEGESSRYSPTLMERYLYCAKRLPDGSVLRLSLAHSTVPALLLGLLPYLAVIAVVTFIFSLFLASRLTERAVAPLNELDLDDPLANDGCDELAPLLHRLDSQQRQIKGQQEKLAQKQKEFETVTENMSEGIVLLNKKGCILSINKAALRLLDTEPSCVGRHFSEVARGPQISALLANGEAALRDEKRIELPAGTFGLHLSPVVSGEELLGSVLLLLDVTEKEKAEQLRREFTANVSHELKTPLQTIAGAAELLAKGIVKEEDRKDFYLRIFEEARRMSRLVEDILRLAHLDEGANDMKREATDLLALAKEMAQALEQEAAEAQVSVSVSGERAVVLGVPQLLRSILFNLCDNAVKYNRRGGKVTVIVHDEEKSCTLIVADTGIGIPPQHRERIFERFYRVDKSRSKELGGTGLGLSIVKHAARAHNAVIDLKSTEGGGTTVRVVFPK